MLLGLRQYLHFRGGSVFQIQPVCGQDGLWKLYVVQQADNRRQLEERQYKGKVVYGGLTSLLLGRTINSNGKGIVSVKREQNKFLKNWRLALWEMEGQGFTDTQVAYIQYGMVLDGWKYTDNLAAR